MLPHRACAQCTNLQFDCETFVCLSLSDTEVPGCLYLLQIHYRSKVKVTINLCIVNNHHCPSLLVCEKDWLNLHYCQQ